MRTKDLIAKRMRRERAHLRKERNKQTEPIQPQKSKAEGEYALFDDARKKAQAQLPNDFDKFAEEVPAARPKKH